MTYHIEETYNGSDIEITVLQGTGTTTEDSLTVAEHTVWGIIDEVRVIETTATDRTIAGIVTDALTALRNEVDAVTNTELHRILTELSFTEQADPVMDFEATPGATGEIILAWDFDIDHDNFIVDRDTVSDFSSSTNIINTSGIVAPYSDTGLTSTTTYYYRAKSQKTGRDDSDWTYANAVAP